MRQPHELAQRQAGVAAEVLETRFPRDHDPAPVRAEFGLGAVRWGKFDKDPLLLPVPEPRRRCLLGGDKYEAVVVAAEARAGDLAARG